MQLLEEPVQHIPLPPVHQCCQPRTEPRTPSSNSNFPTKILPAIPGAADGDAAARCTCPAYLLRVGSFPVLLFGSSCSEVFLSPHLNYSALSLVIRRPELPESKCSAGQSSRTDRLLAAFIRHVASIRRQQRELN